MQICGARHVFSHLNVVKIFVLSYANVVYELAHINVGLCPCICECGGMQTLAFANVVLCVHLHMGMWCHVTIDNGLGVLNSNL